MSAACRCRAFRDWTDKHFHSAERPSVVVFHQPETTSGFATFAPSWGVDSGRETTGPIASADEAVALAKRVFGADVEVPADAR